MNIEDYKYERDEYYCGAAMLACIAAACLYFGWYSVAMFTVGMAFLMVLAGVGTSIWISHK